MKNLRQNRKALSPVVASIILIAVTVAVSIAVAAWMGSMTTGFMATEEVKIVNVSFDADNDKFTVYLRNTGSTTVTITDVYLGSQLVTEYSDIGSEGLLLDPNTADTIVVTGGSEKFSIDEGQSYQIKVLTSKGNPFVYTGTAPTS